MARADRQQVVLGILQNLRNLDGLKKLFWEELNYERENKPLSLRQWPDSVRQALAETPILFASGGEENAFHVVYCQLNSPELKRGLERPIVDQFLREHPYALFVFSNKNQSAWHFLNVKFDQRVERRRLFRRITVRPGAGLRTATERLQLLDLAEINPELFGITPLAIQQRCDVAFDVEAVTKDFFREIANWYFWAVKHVRFPKDAPKEDDGHDHISVIRLITRLIFCWFVKEKGLIPDTLFDEHKLAQILTGFEPTKTPEKESIFYKAILQNLFFATLNTEMDKRGWTKEEQNFMAHSLYRYRECFSEPKSALDLFKEIPFLNGGLFECLDKDLGENAKPRYVRIDGFSRREDSQPIVPDFLFFGGEREVDLSADYGDKKFRRVPVRGLIHIFNRYHFTIEENTPIEQEVALDPELSGKVFENLLAAYNPETGATARKQTGSFYTPREIVNYMVDEALIACLKTKLEDALPSAKDVEARLRHLFAYDNEPHQFTAPEVNALIAAIDGLKSLDPAVGSGAFPMGILHKLVFIIGRLDPRNEKWKERQIARVRDTMATAEMIEDATARERAVRELEQQIASINEAFEHNELDFGRKLYLIENCIYGVDIQPIAVQIAKMRFFISLIVDQKIDDTQPNRGVRPLPNLETKFVAANTLIGVHRPGEQLLPNPNIDAKEAELRRVRERHFLARTLKQKAKCRDDDARLRTEIAELLKGDGWEIDTARRLASWNPYDQNASADFFDAEWMFGITDGFDITIGNPPYGASFNDEAKEYIAKNFRSYRYKYDSYIYFTERALDLLKVGGFVSLITPELWLKLESAEPLRRLIHDESDLRILRICGESIFKAVINTVVFLLRRGYPTTTIQILMDGEIRKLTEAEWVKTDGLAIDYRMREEVKTLISKLRGSQVCPLAQFGEVIQGITPYDRYKGQSPELIKRRGYHFDHKNDKSCGKWLDGGDLARYQLNWSGEWLSYGPWLGAPRDPRFFTGPRLLFREIPGNGRRIQATYVEDETYYHGHSVTPFKQYKESPVDLRYLLAITNSRLLSWYGALHLPNFGKETFPKLNPQDIKMLPIRSIDMNKSVDQASHERIVKLVDRILAAKKKNPDTDTSALEREIDQRVYALYGLTTEEIQIVETSVVK